MAVILFTLFTVLLACTNSQESMGGKMKLTKNALGVPSSVDSRFFGLGGIGDLINSFLPGLNMGNQGGFGGNPQGMDFPANSQFYPEAPIQDPNPSVSSGQGGPWPVLDDASQFPNHGSVQPQYPPQGNFGGFYPQQGNNGRYPQNPGYGGAPQNPTYPNQGNFGGSNPQNPMYPQYPNQGNFGGRNPQYPNFGGTPNQYPDQGPMYPGNPDQGNFGNMQPPVTSSPGNIGGNPLGNDFSNQGGNWNQDPNNSGGGTGIGQGDGTIDAVVPPTGPQDPWNTDTPNAFLPGGMNSSGGENPNNPPFQNPSDGNGNGNAILGRPVQIPPSTTEAGRINYPSSTESSAKRQCVQDCQTTSEYNPVCGSDDVTYINPGKFVCARNCGIMVFVVRQGRCGNIPNPRNVVSSNFRPNWT